MTAEQVQVFQSCARPHWAVHSSKSRPHKNEGAGKRLRNTPCQVAYRVRLHEQQHASQHVRRQILGTAAKQGQADLLQTLLQKSPRKHTKSLLVKWWALGRCRGLVAPKKLPQPKRGMGTGKVVRR